ncbi:hypothetical protein DO97_01510 [Neosynechococcus sphagnicola sy1]|uniref:Methyltransferase FkbM domain-containing protein n=1 Tax=Neosynechococcus sphagnicola sy1 TaxID=1497020 RepID=A0A098TLM2_9CYAN|nr:FkbM family methyltransferase [Neosynechococcus sphagnicola]KGF73210.1 hypothetical protein DO97_01510 [Neosynechococcus sphagnicola sy1]
MNPAVKKLLSLHQLQPVLVDIGASGTPPKMWQDLAAQSVYVGFDPDAREFGEPPSEVFYQSILVNQAVTADPDTTEACFYLTHHPQCSSTLEPDTPFLENYLFSPLFRVVDRVKAPATTLNAVVEQFSLPQIDWIKLDSQGTDLRLFNSLEETLRSHVLAVDIEPGLMDAYRGEDLFVSAHPNLLKQGFWLSDLRVAGAVRMRSSTIEKMTTLDAEINRDRCQAVIKKSPYWCNARYLRSLEWLAESESGQRDYLLLWIFSMIDQQWGFAFEVGMAYQQRFGQDTSAKLMQAEPMTQINLADQNLQADTTTDLFQRLLNRIRYKFTSP